MRNAADVYGHRRRAQSMRNGTKVIFLTADQLDERAAARIRQAEQLPDGEARQHALKNAAQLRTYAAMKRLPLPERPALAASSRRLPMSAVDRVMRAYASKHDLNPSQASYVRKELSKIIDAFMADSPPVDSPDKGDTAD